MPIIPLLRSRLWPALLLGAGITLPPVLSHADVAAPPTQSQADLSAPVKDLKYGEVLYHFFQDQYFSSAVLLLVAQQQQRLPGNGREAELLLGGLYLSYGLHAEAEQIFNRLIDTSVDPATRNRAWFYLGKIRYEKGLFDQAQQAFDKIDGGLEPELQEEYRNLRANLLITSRDYAAAAELLQNAAGDNTETPYDLYNLGVAQLADGKTEAGVKTLEALAATPFAGEEFKALADKAYLALGYAHLNSMPKKARLYLEKVRLRGPFSNRALLGVGWSDYVQEDYRGALRPWLALRERPRTDHSVYESFLAVASALERLAAGTQAAQAYDIAISAFDAALIEIDITIDKIRDGRLPALLLSDAAQHDDSGWTWEADLRPADRDLYFLRDLIASNAFQAAIRNLRDLRFLQSQLLRWEVEIPAYSHMLELRRQTYQAGVQQLAGEQAVTAVAALQERREAYAKILDDMQRRDQAASQFSRVDPNKIEQLASEEERALIDRLASVNARLAALPDLPDRDRYLQRTQLLSGMLYWNISTDYKARFWQAKKQLNAVDRLLVDALEKQLELERTTESAPRQFTGYGEYINALGLRMADVRDRIDSTVAAQESQLNGLALDELRRLRQRLLGYMDQARFSLARLKDRAAARPQMAP